jgi:MFS family permease
VPKVLFYAGTAFCLFLALTAAVESSHELQTGVVSFVALRMPLSVSASAAWAIVVALLAGVAAAGILLRMAALLAARNLFAAFVALMSVSGAVISLTWLTLLQARMIPLVNDDPRALRPLSELHFAALMMLGYFVSLSMLALRPYFRIQASRVLSALVFFPLPLFVLILAQELFTRTSLAPLPGRTPASLVFFFVLAVLFFAISVHCIRHRHLFLEMTNLRELLDSRVDPAGRGTRRTIGGVAFDS